MKREEHGEYYAWLMDIIDGPGEYSLVLDFLWRTEFYSPVIFDDNRAGDGTELRWYFEYETGKVSGRNDECSVLEMMIGLAMRIENDYTYDYEMGDRTSNWFWDMFCNLRLDKFDDFNYDESKITQIVGNFLDRKYGKNGSYSLFPWSKCPNVSKKEKQNWAQIEIWQQMQCYLAGILD